MAACGSLQHMFEAPLPSESPISSWNPQLNHPPHPSSSSSSSSSSLSVTELFGELHFEESPKAVAVPSPPSSSSNENASLFDTMSGGRTDEEDGKKGGYGGVPRHRSGGSLQLCTEGLGFESLDDVEDSNEQEKTGSTVEDDEAVLCNGDGVRGGYFCWGVRRRVCGPVLRRWRSTVVTRRERDGGGRCFPPPISSVNRPWVSLRGYRCDGRFVLKEVTVPAQEFLHASREGGRLRLDFVQGIDEDDDNDVGGDSDNNDEDGEDEENEQGEEEEEAREGNEPGVDQEGVMLVNCDHYSR